MSETGVVVKLIGQNLKSGFSPLAILGLGASFIALCCIVGGLSPCITLHCGETPKRGPLATEYNLNGKLNFLAIGWGSSFHMCDSISYLIPTMISPHLKLCHGAGRKVPPLGLSRSTVNDQCHGTAEILPVAYFIGHFCC